MRLFIGLALKSEVADQLAAITKRVQRADDGLRWSSEASWHVTLQFLGSASPEQYECVVSQLGMLDSPPAPVHLEKLACFDRTGVLYAGVALTPQLLALQQRVTAATRHCGFIPEARAYHPHITLARSKGRGRDFRNLMSRLRTEAAFSSFAATEFLLYESFLGPGGSRYEVRARFPLNAG